MKIIVLLTSFTEKITTDFFFSLGESSVVIMTSWSYKKSGCKVGFHCTCRFMRDKKRVIILYILDGHLNGPFWGHLRLGMNALYFRGAAKGTGSKFVSENSPIVCFDITQTQSHAMLKHKKYNRAFSLTWSAAMQIYWKKKKVFA